jgi:hypothetical protein
MAVAYDAALWSESIRGKTNARRVLYRLRRLGSFCSCKCLYSSKGVVVKEMSRRERIGHDGAVPCAWE